MNREKELQERNRNRTVPLFECDYHLFDQHLEFYTALGFEIIYYQKAPYRFASVIKDGIGEFGFYGAKNFKDTGNIGGCYVYVPNIQEVYAELRANLKAYYGKNFPGRRFVFIFFRKFRRLIRTNGKEASQ